MTPLQKIPILPKKLPLLFNSTEVLLPGVVKTLSLHTNQNRRLINDKFKSDKTLVLIGVVPAIQTGTIGTAAFVQDVFGETVIVTGTCRFSINKIIAETPHYVAEVTQLEKHNKCEEENKNPKIVELVEKVHLLLSFQDDDFPGLKKSLRNIPACFLPEVCTNFINASFDEQLSLLNTLDIAERLKIILILISKSKASVKKYKPLVIRASADRFNNTEEIAEITNRLKQIKMSEDVDRVVKRDLKTLTRIPSFNPEYGVIFSYLSLIADLPWNVSADEIVNLSKARQDFEKDHFGLDNVKKRIIEYLAVRKLCGTTSDSQTPVLCLVGPPGVGKTSIARSIASTLNRPFARVSLGGVSHMSEIRGHRRTYVGAMPGRIIQAVRQSHVNNPVILLDEIDKMTSGVHGNPAAALLEVLDPSQNKEFVDHYLNVPFDLSRVMFIATANEVGSLTPALYDRLEVIKIQGYTYLEKIEIATKHLLPKQLNKNGLSPEKLIISEDVVQLLIHHYTREAGVRDLERRIGALCRAVAVRITDWDNAHLITLPIVLAREEAKDILGPVRFDNTVSFRLGRAGVAIGLVVTSAGGDTLAVESSHMPGSGKLILTGMLGDVMKESAQLAWAWIRANAILYGIDLCGERVSKLDVHVHFPEGAVSKDGPSAGVTIATTLMSLFLDRSILPNVAMTGEITLQGLVLPVGGVKEKIIAAHKNGFNKIIIPHKNAKNLQDIPAHIKDDIQIILVSDMHSVMESAFEGGVTLILPEQYLKTKL